MLPTRVATQSPGLLWLNLAYDTPKNKTSETLKEEARRVCELPGGVASFATEVLKELEPLTRLAGDGARSQCQSVNPNRK